MSSIESLQRDNGHTEHLLGHDCPRLARIEIDISGAFLDDFVGTDGTSAGAREMWPTLPYLNDDDNCEKSHERPFVADASMSLVTGEKSLSQKSTAERSIPFMCFEASPETNVKPTRRSKPEMTVALPPGTPKNDYVGKVILASASICKLSSTTSLRRLHLSRDDAVGLFPEIKKTMDFIYVTDTKKHTAQFKVDMSVSLQDEEGRHWSVVMECLRSAGQRHTRLNKGWSAMCRANKISVGNRIRLARWEQVSSSSAAVVTVSVQ